MSFLEISNWNIHRLMPGYSDRTPLEKERIAEFSLIWQLFEGRVFNHDANGRRLVNETWFGDSSAAIYAEAIDSILYFQNRYLTGIDADIHLEGLIARRGENLRQCIVDGLLAHANPEQAVRGSGAVCLRLRNNLFHGEKANYGFDGQLDNFTHGVRFLNTCLKFLA